jgi:TPP-dependent pyruvate/acetoin dehydrogenase alpha subunit
LAGSSTGGSLISDTKLKQLYATMLQCRLLAQHARTLGGRRRDGYSASLGQEAIVTGCAVDLRSRDCVILAAQQPIAALVKGAKLKTLVTRLYAGDGQTDIPGKHIFHAAPDLAGQLRNASEVALEVKQKQQGHVAVVFIAKQAAQLGDCRQILKAAVSRNLPIMFVVENNPWDASHANNGHLHPALETAIDGLTSMVVDGNDVVAVYRVAYESLDRMRRGGGPVLIEGRTYRQDGRTSPRAERDPLTHMERYLSRKKLFSEDWKNQLVQHFSRDLDDVLQTLDVEKTRYIRASHASAND